MIGVGSLSKGTFAKTLVARARKKSQARKALLAGLMLTPMVDMFSLLVIFLLQTFSTSPEMMVVAKGVSLPEAVHGAELTESLVLAVGAEGIYLDQKPIGKTGEILVEPTALMKALREYRERWERTHPGAQFDGKITIQADRQTPSTVIARLMAMLPSQAYGDIQLAVVSSGGGT